MNAAAVALIVGILIAIEFLTAVLIGKW